MVPPRAVDAAGRDRPPAKNDGALACRGDECRAALGLAFPDIRRFFTSRIACRRSLTRRCCASTHIGVARQRAPNLEVLPLDDALRARDFPPHDRTLDGARRTLRGRSRGGIRPWMPYRTSSSSSRLTKNRDSPGSPWRPARPRSCRSTRRLSCRWVPMTNRPPSAATRS